MRQIEFVAGETWKCKGKERWYTDEYVAKQINRLQNGERCIFWFAFIKIYAAQLDFSAVISQRIAGPWSELHWTKSWKKDVINSDHSRMSKDPTSFKSAGVTAVFPDQPHEGGSCCKREETAVFSEACSSKRR